MINKVEEIRIPCECVGGSVLEAISNNFLITGLTPLAVLKLNLLGLSSLTSSLIIEI